MQLKLSPRKSEVIFKHIPKTAGLSIRRFAYNNFMTVLGHDIRKNDYQHLSEYIKNKNVMVFTFVRNPWDRLVSTYFFLQNGGLNFADELDRQKYLSDCGIEDFENFVKNYLTEGNILEQLHFRPQHTWIFERNRCLANKIYKFEQIDKSIINLCQTFEKVKPYKIIHINKSKRTHYSNYYNEETRDIVGRVYEKDIELFNYSYENSQFVYR